MAPQDEDAPEPALTQALMDLERTSGRLRRAADAYYSATPEEKATARAEYIRAIQDDSRATSRVMHAKTKTE